jgi:hypothetical protein
MEITLTQFEVIQMITLTQMLFEDGHLSETGTNDLKRFHRILDLDVESNINAILNY